MPGSIVHLFIFFCLWPHEEGVGDDHLPVWSKARALVHLQKEMKLIRQQVNKIKDVRGWQSEQCDWTRRTSLTRRSPCRCPPRPCHRCPPPPSAQLQPRSCQQKQWRKDCDKHYLLMTRCQIWGTIELHRDLISKVFTQSQFTQKNLGMVYFGLRATKTFAYSMSYIFGKLWHSAIIWPIWKPF